MSTKNANTAARTLNIVLSPTKVVTINLDEVTPELIQEARVTVGDAEVWRYIAEVLEMNKSKTKPTAKDVKKEKTMAEEEGVREDLNEEEQKILEDTQGLSEKLRLEQTIYRLRKDIRSCKERCCVLEQELKTCGDAFIATMKEAKLSFMTNPPSKPKLRVVFDLGKAGRHSKAFHAISRNGIFLSLIYDSRYEGDRFIPAKTDAGETISVALPSYLDETTQEQVPAMVVTAVVPGFEQVIGCLDIVNLLIIDDFADTNTAVVQPFLPAE